MDVLYCDERNYFNEKQFSVMLHKRFADPPHGATAHNGPGPPHYRGFTITVRHITLGRTILDG
jgi:hypothetical protein